MSITNLTLTNLICNVVRMARAVHRPLSIFDCVHRRADGSSAVRCVPGINYCGMCGTIIRHLTGTGAECRR